MGGVAARNGPGDLESVLEIEQFKRRHVAYLRGKLMWWCQ